MSFLAFSTPQAARRAFLGNSGLLLSGTAIALLSGREVLAKQAGGSKASDVRILNTALAAELEAVAAYQVGAESGLLEKPVLDSPKNLGFVKVADLPALRVLSIAARGDMEPAAIAQSEKKLTEALESRSDLEPAGPPRLLGYNGPDVAAEKRYWELQIPVRKKEAK